MKKNFAKIEYMGISGLAAASEADRRELFRLARIGAWFLKHHELLNDCVVATGSVAPDYFKPEKRSAINLLNQMINSVNSTWSPSWTEDYK